MSFNVLNCLLLENDADSIVFQTLRLYHGLAVHRHARFGTDWLFGDLPVDFAAAVVLNFPAHTWAPSPHLHKPFQIETICRSVLFRENLAIDNLFATLRLGFLDSFYNCVETGLTPFQKLVLK
jgi:hypothetical protein